MDLQIKFGRNQITQWAKKCAGVQKLLFLPKMTKNCVTVLKMVTENENIKNPLFDNRY